MKVFIHSLILVCGASLGAQAAPERSAPPLRQIVAEKFPDGNVFIGGTTGWEKLDRPVGPILDREFSYITPENDFKQSLVHPRPGVWNWEAADGWVERALEKGQILRIHGPVSPQCSRWAKNDERTPAELEENMRAFFTALCKRYNGHPAVRWMDVVNETVLPRGQWFGPKPGVTKWENPWTILGSDPVEGLNPPSYIRIAFEIANRHAPDIKLVYNQHASMEPPMWDKVKRTILYLKDQGLRVDGVGWQAHIDTGWEKEPGNTEFLHQLISWTHGQGMEFHVTENSVYRKKPEDTPEDQAQTFAAVLSILLQHRDRGVVTWNVWNISDATAWERNREFKACLFDDQFQPKPAYFAIQKLLINPPKTRKQ
jgi:endo-1,4-beta-xylanase